MLSSCPKPLVGPWAWLFLDWLVMPCSLGNFYDGQLVWHVGGSYLLPQTWNSALLQSPHLRLILPDNTSQQSFLCLEQQMTLSLAI